jgi:hypothetical protein
LLTLLIAQIYALPPVTFPDIGTPEAASCFYNAASGLARLEPPQGSFFFGFSPLWINGEVFSIFDYPINLAVFLVARRYCSEIGLQRTFV